jgi:hypothetical protein
MFDMDASWEKEVPVDLLLAVENLRDSFENDVWACKLGVPGLKCASGEERHWTRRAYGTREEVPA